MDKEDPENLSSELDEEDDTRDDTTTLLPIFVDKVIDLSEFKDAIAAVSKKSIDYSIIYDGTTRLQMLDFKAHRAAVKYFEKTDTVYFMYPVHVGRGIRVVFKGIDSNTHTETIANDIEKYGFKVRRVTNIISQRTGKALSMFYVDLQPSIYNQKIFEIKLLGDFYVEVMEPKSPHGVTVCYRCLQFGHIEEYCKEPVSCRKCTCNHATEYCPKPDNFPPMCFHCGGDHMAGFEGCGVYIHESEKSHRKLVRALNGGRNLQPSTQGFSYSRHKKNKVPYNLDSIFQFPELEIVHMRYPIYNPQFRRNYDDSMESSTHNHDEENLALVNVNHRTQRVNIIHHNIQERLNNLTELDKVRIMAAFARLQFRCEEISKMFDAILS